MHGHVFIRNGTQCEIQGGIKGRTRSLELLDNYGGRGLIVGRAMTRGVDMLPRFQRTKASSRMKFDAQTGKLRFSIEHDQNL